MEKTLVIMAAGMGSRFGGLKQITPMGPSGEFIIDYSIYDAIRVGFNKVVFIIKKENYDDFEQTIGKRLEGQIKVEYAFQDVKDIPVSVPFERVKPWGTGQAILCAEKYVDDNFLVINADDYYGYDAFKVASDYLEKASSTTYGLIGYTVTNTLTENGSVKRGVCNILDNNLQSICESSIIRENNVIKATSLLTNENYEVSNDTLVSMNMFIFNPSIFKYLKDDFKTFLDGALENSEFLLPEVVASHIKSGDITVEVLKTNSKWYGVTYKEDTPLVKDALLKMTNEKLYPLDLWRK